MDRFDWLEIDRAAPTGSAAVLERPHDGPTYHRAARVMREAGHFRAAADFYEKAVSYEEHDYGAWVELIDTLVRARQLDSAAEKARYALDQFRQVRSLYAAQALVFSHQDRNREAIQHAQIALEGAERTWYALCVQAEVLLRNSPENREQALELLVEALRLSSMAWEPAFIGGSMLLDAALPAQAASYFAEAAHFQPRAPLSWLCLGDCFYALKLYDQALFYYQRVIDLEPMHELALERQRACGPKLFGLMRAFRKPDLHARWKEEYRKLTRPEGPYDF